MTKLTQLNLHSRLIKRHNPPERQRSFFMPISRKEVNELAITTTNYNDVKNAINGAANTGSTPQYQDTNALGNIASNYYSALQPVQKATYDSIDQGTYNNMQALKEHMSNTGQWRGGATNNRMMGLMNANTQAKGEANANLYNTALSNANNAAQLGLSEQSQLYGQQYNKASQLQSLLSQQQADNQQQTANQYTEAGLTGMLGNNQTLANKTLQETQRQANASQDTTTMQLIQSYLNSLGEYTDNYQVPTTYAPGDSMQTLLNRLLGYTA